MVNQSKINDPRFWARWEKAGAVGNINGPVKYQRPKTNVLEEINPENNQSQPIYQRPEILAPEINPQIEMPLNPKLQENSDKMTLADYIKNDWAQTKADLQLKYETTKNYLRNVRDNSIASARARATIIRQRTNSYAADVRDYIRTQATVVKQRTADYARRAGRATSTCTRNAVTATANAAVNAGRYVKQDIERQIHEAELREKITQRWAVREKQLREGQKDLTSRLQELYNLGRYVRPVTGAISMQSNVIQYSTMTSPGVYEGYIIDTINGTAKKYKITRRSQ